MNRKERILAAALLTLAVSLLLVGWVSGTVLRHVVQIVPAVLAAVVVLQSRPWHRSAAAPILAFWLFIMVLIWLYVLGLTRVISGRFTTVEIVLTVVMGLACAVGLVLSMIPGRGVTWKSAAVAFLFFSALQFGAMWLSFRPAIANR